MQNSGTDKPAVDGYVPALDGIRGLAIIIVMLGHFAYGFQDTTPADTALKTLMQTGWAGVDLFFVLSGFLITGILLEAKGASYYFRNFYARRVLRIFPAYYAFLFLFFVAFPRIVHPDPAGPFGGWNAAQWWFWGYASNFQILFPAWPRPLPLTHLWSLAVEEQFYLVWPAVVLLASKKGLVRICIGCMILSVALRIGIQLSGINPTAAYRITPARLDTLATGAMLAVFVRDPQWWNRLKGYAKPAIAAMLVGLVIISIPTRSMLQTGFLMQAVGYTLLALLGAGLIVVGIDPGKARGRLARFLSSPVMRFFGKYSYAMYLIHFPIAWFSENLGFGVARYPAIGGSHIPSVIAFTLVTTGLTTICALLSWNLFEKHFLRLKRFFPRADERPVAEVTTVPDKVFNITF
jgi:peptidoglycan/LPS O-acetylase OafA/YrhL